MVDPELIKQEWGDFFKRHPYTDDRLKSLPSERFIRKWKMLLKWQDDTKVTGGTSHEVEAHKNHLTDTCKILERFPPSQYPKILDLGCGGGETEALRRLGYQATGFTLGPLNVIWAKEKYGLDLIYGDMHDLPFPSGVFDAVLSKESFEHCFAPILVTIEVWRVLRPHGRWMLTQPDSNNEVGFDWSHSTVLNARQRKALFENFGFRVLENTENFSLCEKPTEKELEGRPALGIYQAMEAIV